MDSKFFTARLVQSVVFGIVANHSIAGYVFVGNRIVPHRAVVVVCIKKNYDLFCVEKKT